MPSLHAAGALLIFWNSRSFGWTRIIAFLYLLLTLLATLGFGEHYIIDLVVAAPYALLMQALATECSNQALVALLGVGCVLSWIGLLYYAIPLLADSRVALLTATAATFILTAIGRALLCRNAPFSDGEALPLGSVE